MPRGVEAQPISSVRWVPRAHLEANDYNPNHVPPLERRLLKHSLLRQGWTAPVVTFRGRTIVDGFHRWDLAAEPEVGDMTGGLVPIVVCADMTEAERISATVRHNRARGVHGIVPMMKLVRRLLESGQLTEAEVMRDLGMQAEEVNRLADLRPNPEILSTPGGVLGEAWNPEG